MNNLILEQEDYVLPCHNSNETLDSEGGGGGGTIDTELNYSLNKQIERLVHHNYNMTRGGNSKGRKKNKEKEDDLNATIYQTRAGNIPDNLEKLKTKMKVFMTSY